MPTKCRLFLALDDRVQELSKKFLDDQVQSEATDPAGFQPDLDRLAAFKLLVHAEIEEFLEEKASENLAMIRGEIRQGSPCMKAASGLLVAGILLDRPWPSSKGFDGSRLADYIDEIISAGMRAITENNGVKQASFVLLSILSGKALDEIDSILASNLNSYGSDRGDIAHRSVKRSRTLLAPSAEKLTALALISSIGSYYDVCR